MNAELPYVSLLNEAPLHTTCIVALATQQACLTEPRPSSRRNEFLP